MKLWRARLREVYLTRAEWRRYSDMYGLAIRLGYTDPDLAWLDNPFIHGSTNPADYGLA